MNYKLRFEKRALKDWQKLDASTKTRLKKKLVEVLENPHVPANRLSGRPNLYKIKLMTPATRLVYSVDDDVVTVSTLVLGLRDKIYKDMMKRL